ILFILSTQSIQPAKPVNPVWVNRLSAINNLVVVLFQVRPGTLPDPGLITNNHHPVPETGNRKQPNPVCPERSYGFAMTCG
ncbi:MAG: hypothetical protein KDD10_25600, partial [Phaeodactylibacter sp.]|nr:hypothetical protein [Phaeodactylibacter sp.]